MANAIEPGEAGAALSEVRRRQGEVIERSLVPTWYWWTVAVPMVGLGVVVDTHDAVAIASAAVVFAVGVALLTAWIIVGGLRQVKVHDALLGPRGAGSSSLSWDSSLAARSAWPSFSRQRAWETPGRSRRSPARLASYSAGPL